MATSSTGFNTQGATPGLQFSVTPSSGNTPQGRALSTMQTSTPQYATSIPSAYGPVQTGYGTTSNPKPSLPTQPGLIQPTTAVKSHTIGADGTVSQTYHAPADITPTPTKATDAAANTAGATITDTSGNTGTAEFNSMTGQPLNAAATPTITAPQTNSTLTTTGTPTTYSGLINKSAADYQTAADTNQVIKQSENNAEHNPNYSLDTGLGISGLIQKNYGLQGENALTTAQGEATLANSVKPEPTAQGQTTYNPLTNSFAGGSYSDNLNTIVDAIKSGSMGYTKGVSALSSLSPTAQADVLKALGPGFNTVQSDANAAATGSSEQTQLQTKQAHETAYKQIQNLAPQLGDLISTFNLNPNDIQALNKGLAAIANNTSSSQYRLLQSYINSIAGLYSQILPVSQDVLSQNILSSTQKGQNITDTIQGLAAQAQAIIDKDQTTGSGGTGSNDPLGIR